MIPVSKWIDLTYPISEYMPAWPGQPRTRLGMADRMADGGVANVTTLAMSMHSGTHIDAPCHFLENGLDVLAMPVELMNGRARVVEIPERSRHVTKSDIKRYEARQGDLLMGDRVLFRTRNTSEELMGSSEFHEDYAAIAPDAAAYLVDRMVSLVGVDYLSVAPFNDPATTHRTLLGAGVWVIEGMDLREVREGTGQLMVMPMKVERSDAAPARAFYCPDFA